MRSRIKSQHGVSLIAAIFIIVILAFMGLMFVTLITTGSLTAANDAQSAQALYIAEGGSQFAKYQLSTGTTCTNLTNTNVPLGPGTFTTSGALFTPAATTLFANITAVATTIPVANTAGYAPQGRITITDLIMGNETIWYGGIAGNNFINARRGVGGTTAVAHNILPTPPSVSQNQCRITSTGSVVAARRVVTADVAGSSGSKSSASLDNPSTLISSAALTDIGTLPTSLIAGDNLIIVVVLFQNTNGTGGTPTISAGNLQLQKGGTVLASNQSLIRVEGTTAPAPDNFPQETQFLLYRDVGAAANPTYNVVAQANVNNRISARVKMVVFNSVLNSYFFDEPANVELGNGVSVALSSHATGLPAPVAGDANVIIAAVQLDNQRNANRTIYGKVTTGGDGYLSLRRGGVAGTVLTSNQYDIGLERNGNANEGTGFLLIARDTAAAANQTYTVTGRASNDRVNGEVKMLVFNGLLSAFVATNRINPLPTALTSWALLTPTFPAGDNIVISASQYWDSDGFLSRNIQADQLIYGALISSNTTPIYLATGNQVDDYPTGLLLYHQNAPANPTYNWQSQANGANVQADAEIMAIHLISAGTVVDYGWQ